MRFYVRSLQAIEALAPLAEPHALVSISTPGAPTARPRTGPSTRAVLRLWFPDLGREHLVVPFAEIKEIKLRPKGHEEDLALKVKTARRLLETGHKVRFQMELRDRAVVRPSAVREQLEYVVREVEDLADLESGPLGVIAMSALVAPRPAAIHKYKPEELFSRGHARLILGFAKALGTSVEAIVVHCEGGLSRSPGVAAALQKIMEGDDTEWFKSKTPNSLVYSLILEEATEEEWKSLWKEGTGPWAR